MAKTRIKAKEKKGVVTVKTLSKHPMLSYVEAKRAKKEVNFITHFMAEANGKVVYEVSTSQFLSKDPYMKFKFTGAKKGDEITITWVDLKGNKDVSTKKIR
ncbi:thiosulfate oxidation carrier complex protein SoxZ [Malaciobacter marinus]|uniref:Sulfur oxidation protein SoxYZ, sulfur compound chelating protein n=1 Tax=Malaciobacter marinus TaxID=505249 RepID=A0A347TIM6_9BACT|nr:MULTISPECIES: thiosulfate oxidation carrier complex protein SoxZ [Malaciobacter]AXX86454.1 sulfur oxidation protein SoxYZ, sulfur compound chelating protein [Malaciobacter marinus]PHO15458.1 thiosulfate oxidation carrier complex protein SoxZ [Malaciobacter marinus]RYA23418.1 thiosulfate oxidation carrier complex protein SoxZ [Malaciobacter halophilus]